MNNLPGTLYQVAGRFFMPEKQCKVREDIVKFE